ncbi:MAG: hypothetical protein D6807_00660 [Alphaproteobacteria bacterium]|nr:MAG: hypothetical protein D6807_00660 [Alphaproteobacteria bacterium]
MSPRQSLRLLPVLLLAACGGLVDLGPGGPAPALYTLPAVAPATEDRTTALRVLVEAPNVAGALDSDRIAIRTSPIRIEYLAGARWEDRVPLLAARYFTDVLDARDGIAAASALDADLPVAYRLRLDLRVFETDMSPEGASGEARVVLAATLQRATSSEIVADRIFTASQETRGRSADAIVEAMGTAMETLAASLADWVAHRLATAPAGAQG